MNKPREDTEDYLSIFLNDTPIMDVRAPVEYQQGAFPNSKNIPLLDNDQRQQIGIRYKDAGEQEAVKLGLKLATPEIKAQRLSDWSNFCRQHPNGYLYCFRGGLRSRTTQQWLKDNGITFPLIRGGYKALRRFLIDQMEKNLMELEFIIIAGPTGSGKTVLLHKLPGQVDLEGLANHRGSAFGKELGAQPSQIDWENSFSVNLLKHAHGAPKQPVFLEDESRLIGRISLPPLLQKNISSSKVIRLQCPVSDRVQIIKKEYILREYPTYLQHFGQEGHQQFEQRVLGNLERIKKRLGGVRYSQVQNLFKTGLQALKNQSEDTSNFDRGIEILLTQYYDPMYEYQASKKLGEVIFKGSHQEILEWIKQQNFEKSF